MENESRYRFVKIFVENEIFILKPGVGYSIIERGGGICRLLGAVFMPRGDNNKKQSSSRGVCRAHGLKRGVCRAQGVTGAMVSGAMLCQAVCVECKT